MDHKDPSIVFQKVNKKYPCVLQTLEVLERKGVLNLRPGSQLFPKFDLSEFSLDAEEVVIAPPVTSLTPEQIQEVNDKLAGKSYQGTSYEILSKIAKWVRFHLKLNAQKPTKLRIREYFANRAVQEIAESLMPPFPNPPIILTEPLDLDDFSSHYTSSLLGPIIPSIISRVLDYLNENPNPPRKLPNSNVLEEINKVLPASGEPNRITRGPSAANQPQHVITSAPAAPASPTAPTAVRLTVSRHDVVEENAAEDYNVERDVEHDVVAHEDGMNYGAEDYEPLQLSDDFGPNLEGNPWVAPNPATRGNISLRPNKHISRTHVRPNTEGNTNDDSIAVLECLDMNRGHKRGANARLVQNGPTTPKRQATADESAELKAMLEAAKRDAENQAEHNAATQARLEALISKVNADNQAKTAIIRDLQAKGDSLNKENKMLRAKLRSVALKIAKLEKILAEVDWARIWFERTR